MTHRYLVFLLSLLLPMSTIYPWGWTAPFIQVSDSISNGWSHWSKKILTAAAATAFYAASYLLRKHVSKKKTCLIDPEQERKVSQEDNEQPREKRLNIQITKTESASTATIVQCDYDALCTLLCMPLDQTNRTKKKANLDPTDSKNIMGSVFLSIYDMAQEEQFNKKEKILYYNRYVTNNNRPGIWPFGGHITRPLSSQEKEQFDAILIKTRLKHVVDLLQQERNLFVTKCESYGYPFIPEGAHISPLPDVPYFLSTIRLAENYKLKIKYSGHHAYVLNLGENFFKMKPESQHFTIAHELMHIAHHEHNKKPNTAEQRRKLEEDCDIGAARFLGTAQGGIDDFTQAMRDHPFTDEALLPVPIYKLLHPNHTHPHPTERIAYLREFQEKADC